MAPPPINKSGKNITLKILAANKKATFLYQTLEKYNAGIVLKGSEVKSVWDGKMNLSDAYCLFKNGELWIRNLHISEYPNAGQFNHEPKTDRKLLLKKRELNKLLIKTKERGLTIVPMDSYLNENNWIKFTIALVKGKKSYDKRESIKEKDLDRENYRSQRIK